MSGARQNNRSVFEIQKCKFKKKNLNFYRLENLEQLLYLETFQ